MIIESSASGSGRFGAGGGKRVLDPVLCQGFPREADFKALDNLAATIAEKHREHNLVN